MEFILGLVVFIADIYAIAKVINSGAPTLNKVLWILLILVLPVIGFLIWYFAGPK